MPGHNPSYIFRGIKADIWEGGDMTAEPEPEAEYAQIMLERTARRKAWEKAGEKPLTWGQIQRKNGK